MINSYFMMINAVSCIKTSVVSVLKELRFHLLISNCGKNMLEINAIMINFRYRCNCRVEIVDLVFI